MRLLWNRLSVAALFMGLALPGWAASHKIVTVAADGTGDFKEVQAAIDSAPDSGLTIQIKPGIYKQKLHVLANHVEIIGLGSKPEDVVLSWDDSAKTAGGTTKSASVTVTGDDFRAENLTFENAWERTHASEHEGSQAVALLVSGDRDVFRHVRLLGFQDTLYANSKKCHSADEVMAGAPCRASRQYFADCYIEGHVDYIFGDAKAVFDRCELHSMPHAVTTITAQSRVYPAEDSGYLFLNCTVTAAAGADNTLLGRPWRAYATTYFLNTNFVANLNPAGWSEWDGKLKTSSYAEFGSHGNAGDIGKRIAGSHQLSASDAAKLTVKAWLAGTDGWNPEAVR
ncbi:pectinesterase [Granulicella rosea]|uniref:Pectinesterase n=1 Tax=Granulicella rosea TaxID=474952 RepID=A0A239HTE8_9BACT|nr:pectinesterase family protein [Granulicella rosea]SNS84093.1 pectinesterase [Granulicella rosea]